MEGGDEVGLVEDEGDAGIFFFDFAGCQVGLGAFLDFFVGMAGKEEGAFYGFFTDAPVVGGDGEGS